MAEELPERQNLSNREVYFVAGTLGLLVGVFVWFLTGSLMAMMASGSSATAGYEDRAFEVFNTGVLVSYLGALLLAVLAKKPRLWFFSLAGYVITFMIVVKG